MDLYTNQDLLDSIDNMIINSDVSIFGNDIKQLGNIRIINGSLSLVSSLIESLGELRIINGSFVISTSKEPSLLESLEYIEEIHGDCWLRYSNIKSLGVLERVDGNLNLRDTKIENLGVLNYVGGNLFLPISCKDKIELSNVTIIGKLRFWNNENRSIVVERENVKIKISDIPSWTHTYIYSKNVYNSLDSNQRGFYDKFKKAFLNNFFFDLRNEENYIFLLFFDICAIESSIDRIKYLNNLKSNYSITSNYVDDFLIKYYDSFSLFEESWRIIETQSNIEIETVIEYEFKIGKRLLNQNILSSLISFDYLTSYGVKHIDYIKDIFNQYLVDYEANNKIYFFNSFINPNCVNISYSNYLKCVYDFFVADCNANFQNLNYYKPYFLTDADFQEFKSWDLPHIEKADKFYRLPHLIKKAIVCQLKIILRDCENLLRKSRNMPLIGEGWISETDLYYKIKENFKQFQIIHHAKPKWIGRQHLDIYISELNIALEYQGRQHFEPVDFFGGQESFRKTVERDLLKKKLCKDNDCILYYVLENYDINDLINRIKNAR